MRASTQPRVVVVSYFHPPFPGAGGNRWEAMGHYLGDLGFSVTTIACDAWGVLRSDPDLEVIRMGDLRSISVLRRALRRGDLALVGDSATIERPPTALLTQVVVPDLHAISWAPAVALRVRQMVLDGQVDCLVTTSPPASAHLVGLALGPSRPAWIADFRDGWRFQEAREPFPTALQRRMDAWLERRVAETADFTTGATRPIAADLEGRLGARSVCVANGWDPRLEPQRGDAVSALSTSEGVTLVVTGTLSGTRGRDPAPLLNALRAVTSGPSALPVRIVHAGRLTTDERALIDRAGVADIVQHLGTLSRTDALALQRSADALVLLTSRNSSEATSKIFEYLAAGRPILALAAGNEAERIVRETNTGLTVSPDDVVEIELALRRVASGELARDYAPRGLERFTYPGPAEEMARLIEEAIRSRSRS